MTRIWLKNCCPTCVDQLGRESLAELSDELRATAQCSIDVLVRNLFERTADVGFLATDDVLRESALVVIQDFEFIITTCSVPLTSGPG